MNAPLRPFGQLLAPSFDFHGLKLDLYGTLDEDGYRVKHACYPGSQFDVSSAMSAELVAALGMALCDLRPSGARQDDMTAWHRDVEMYGLGGVS